MASLVNICLVLALLIVRVISLKEIYSVNIEPNMQTFYSEFGKKPKENIICGSDCKGGRNCKYKWIEYINKTALDFSEGNILFLTKNAEKTSIFRCYVHDSRYYGYSNEITVNIKGTNNRQNTPTTHIASVIQWSANTVYSHSTTASTYVQNDESFLSVQLVIIISICGGAIVLLIAMVVLVGILCVKTKQNKSKTCKESRRNNTTQEKDRELELTENTLYITTDNITKIPPSNNTQNDKPTIESGNDVYAVVNKPGKTEYHNPVYAEVNNSQPENDITSAENKPSGKEAIKPGQNVNKDGMVYIEIDFKDMPSNGKSTMQGEENKTLYVDIDSTKQTEPHPMSG